MTFCKTFRPTGNMIDKELVEGVGHAAVAHSTEARRKREGEENVLFSSPSLS